MRSATPSAACSYYTHYCPTRTTVFTSTGAPSGVCTRRRSVYSPGTRPLVRQIPRMPSATPGPEGTPPLVIGCQSRGSRPAPYSSVYGPRAVPRTNTCVVVIALLAAGCAISAIATSGLVCGGGQKVVGGCGMPASLAQARNSGG